MEKIKIVIADDHLILRDGLKAALNFMPDLEVIGEAGDGVEVIEISKKLVPDVILMDISMPRLDGISATKELKKILPKIKIIILTMHDNRQFILDALYSGVDGFLLKMGQISDVQNAVKLVMQGKKYFDKNISKQLGIDLENCDDIEDAIKGVKPFDLSNREMEILKCISFGMSTRAISKKLSLSYHTLTNHRKSICVKEGANNTADLILFCLKHKISIEKH
ncbi:MAG: response regulator transcription factor [Bacteroidetes bacterium]|nr:response regulator transcription factor [Bacteroidota bacterium]